MRLLVYRIGLVGDTIVALPALWAVRRHFPEAHITMLGEHCPGTNQFPAAELLQNAGVVDEFLSYSPPRRSLNRMQKFVHAPSLLLKLRRKRFDTLIYLAPSSRDRQQVARDRQFFALAGIKKFLGTTGFAPLPESKLGQRQLRLSSEVDLLLERLAASNIPVPPPGAGCMDLGLSQAEESEIEHWLSSLPGDSDRSWFGVGAGSKMAAKRWPIESFGEVGRRLIEEFDLWPVVFGSAEERVLGERLLDLWGRGYNAAGTLSLRGAAVGLTRCQFYLGNDTGTMHLAAAVGVRCVAVFSARDFPGKWYPYGGRHIVLRAGIDCEGCMLETCVDRQNACLTAITPLQVWEACRRVAQVDAPAAKMLAARKE